MDGNVQKNNTMHRTNTMAEISKTSKKFKMSRKAFHYTNNEQKQQTIVIDLRLANVAFTSNLSHN